MDLPPSEITALTLNCWGLKYISALRTERSTEIGLRLAALSAPADKDSLSDAPLSIVALQECWVYDDFATIHRLTAQHLPYAKFFRAGVWGAGLAVLSRWPITESSMRVYSLSGRPTAFWRGDWFVGKGIASATIAVPAGGPTIEVILTHTHAPYESGKPPEQDSYLVHRLSEAWEVGKRLRAAAERGRLVLGMGDFNMTPLSTHYRMLQLGCGGAGGGAPPVRDVWRVLHPDSSLGPSNNRAEQARQQLLQQGPNPPRSTVPEATFNLTENGATSDNVYNTWRWPKEKRKRLHKQYQHLAADDREHEFAVAPNMPDPRGKRLDYIFYLSPLSSSSGTDLWSPKSARVALVEPHPTLGCSVSDHFAVLATLARQPGLTESTADRILPTPLSTARDAPQSSVYDEVLAYIDIYMARERRQQFWRSVHFFVSVVVSIGCLVAVWFSPRAFVSFLLMLLSTLGLATGVVDGLLALLFFGSEMRSVQEFQWEMQNAKALASGRRFPTAKTVSDPA